MGGIRVSLEHEGSVRLLNVVFVLVIGLRTGDEPLQMAGQCAPWRGFLVQSLSGPVPARSWRGAPTLGKHSPPGRPPSAGGSLGMVRVSAVPGETGDCFAELICFFYHKCPPMIRRHPAENAVVPPCAPQICPGIGFIITCPAVKVKVHKKKWKSICLCRIVRNFQSILAILENSRALAPIYPVGSLSAPVIK